MTPPTAPSAPRGRLFLTGLLAGGLLLVGCSGKAEEKEATAPDQLPPPAATSDPPPAAGTDPNQQGVENVVDGLGTALRISLQNVASYDVEGSTLTVRFASGSKDEATSHCLISRGAAQGLGLPEDYRLVMAYPDGDKECAQP